MRSITYISLALLFMVFSGASYAQENAIPNPGAPCDLDRCDECQSTACDNYCASELAKEQDKVLNVEYQKLLSIIDSNEQKNLIKQAQRSWVDFKKSNYEFSRRHLYMIANIEYLSCKVNEHRANELKFLIKPFEKKKRKE